MSEPVLSVLIPAMPSRFMEARDVFGHLTWQILQAKRDDVEVLMLFDNKMRTVGGKRQALLDIARGKYVCFVDDDDSVSSNYIAQIVKGIDRDWADCIMFDSTCSIDGAPAVKVSHYLQNENEQYSPEGFSRGLWHIHPIKRVTAQRYKFPDINNGEDWGWLKQVIPDVQSQYIVDAPPLYHYIFNSKTTEASK